MKGHWIAMSSSALAAVVVGYSSTILIIMQAANAIGASEAQKVSWSLFLCLAMGGVTLLLSLKHRLPIIIAWSMPGAVLTASSVGISYTAGLGAFAVAGLLMVATGLVKPLATAIGRMPGTIASAMLAGVLLPYVLKVPPAAMAAPTLVLPLVVAFFVMRLWKPMWTIPVVVVLGLAVAFISGAMKFSAADMALARPVFDVPSFSLTAIISLAVPLYLVTMAGQNLPGFAVLRADGYVPPVSSILVATGGASALLSPFMGPQVNLSSITASLCTGPHTHPDPAQRWKVSIPYVIQYAIVGLGSGVFIKLLGGLPSELIIAIAGLGLFGPLMGAMTAMMKDDIEPAVVTFVVTASGLTLFSIGPAFWGLVVGLGLWAVKKGIAK